MQLNLIPFLQCLIKHFFNKSGGRNRDRTCDIRLVRPTLSHLSYPPTMDFATILTFKIIFSYIKELLSAASPLKRGRFPPELSARGNCSSLIRENYCQALMCSNFTIILRRLYIHTRLNTEGLTFLFRCKKHFIFL